MKEIYELEVLILQGKKEEGLVNFMKYCQENFKDWKGNPVVFSEDQLKNENLKSSIRMCIHHYHPDRKKQDKVGRYSQNDINLRNQITMILNKFSSQI